MGESGASVRIAIDVGGTFTDLQILDASNGAITSLKTPTTPEDPSIGLMAGIDEAAAPHRLRAGRYPAICCTAPRSPPTPCSNASCREGVLITTAGFEDVSRSAGTTAATSTRSIRSVPPALIPRDRRLGVAERIRADGTRRPAARRAGCRALVRRVDRAGAAAVAVCLLNSYVNPAHERVLRRRIPAPCRP